MKGIRIDLEFDWDRGPEITITIFAKRTHIIGIYWSAYPVLGGAKPVDNPPYEFTDQPDLTGTTMDDMGWVQQPESGWGVPRREEPLE